MKDFTFKYRGFTVECAIWVSPNMGYGFRATRKHLVLEDFPDCKKPITVKFKAKTLINRVLSS